MDTIFRPPRLDDAAELASLCAELGYPSTPGDVSRRLRLLAQVPGHLVLVAVEDMDRPIGWIHVCIVKRLESEPMAEVGGMVVSEKRRGRGIGAALLAEAEKWALSAHIKTLRVRSNIVRERAHHFYSRAGYSQTKTSHVFEKSLG